MTSDTEWRRDAGVGVFATDHPRGFPLVAYVAGSTETSTPIVLEGATLTANLVYRCPLNVTRADRFSLQWQQVDAGTGSIASHRFLITNSPAPLIAEFARPDIWSDVSAVYAFTALPSGTEASEHYPIANVQGTWMLLELTVGIADVTGLSIYGQVR